MNSLYQTPDPNKRAFARTNSQTIAQRVTLLRELLPGTASVAEICCGDCSQQWLAYTQQLGVRTFRGLDIEPGIVAKNREQGIECVCGDALDRKVLQSFLGADVIFFGPPLSVDCDGHRLLAFREVTPRYGDFAWLLLDGLGYRGTLVCICPKTTTMGDITWLHHQITSYRKDFGLRLIHRTYSTLTGDGQETELRLKYVELVFSSHLEDKWEIRESKP